MQQFHKFIIWRLCVAQHVSGAPRPSSGAYNCIRSLWFYRWRAAVGALLVVVWQDLPDHDQQHSNHDAPTVEPEAPSAVVLSWWWAERRPKHVKPHINVKW